MKLMHLKDLCLFLTIFACANAEAVISFSVQFFNSSGDPVGSGTYSFDDIPNDQNTPFNDLTNLVWAFELPSFGISISSADDDSTSRESFEDEGVYVTTINDLSSLRFFDDVGSYISHNDESASLRTSVRFVEFSNNVQYIKDDITLGTGTFTTTPIPEPAATPVLIALMGGSSIFAFKRCKANKAG